MHTLMSTKRRQLRIHLVAVLALVLDVIVKGRDMRRQRRLLSLSPSAFTHRLKHVGTTGHCTREARCYRLWRLHICMRTLHMRLKNGKVRSCKVTTRNRTNANCVLYTVSFSLHKNHGSSHEQPTVLDSDTPSYNQETGMQRASLQCATTSSHEETTPTYSCRRS